MIAKAAATEHQQALDKPLWRSLAWVGGTKWLIQIFTWVSTVFVARALAPNDYAIIGLASLYVGVVALLADSGVASAVITLRALKPVQIAQLHLLSGVLGTGLFANFLSISLADWALLRYPWVTADYRADEHAHRDGRLAKRSRCASAEAVPIPLACRPRYSSRAFCGRMHPRSGDARVPVLGTRDWTGGGGGALVVADSPLSTSSCRHTTSP